MTKYYCDMCGKEMSMMDKIAKVEISPLGAVTHMGDTLMSVRNVLTG